MRMGSATLKCRDPFNDIDPLVGDSISFEDDFSSPKKVIRVLINESDSHNDYVLDDEWNAFVVSTVM